MQRAWRSMVAVAATEEGGAIWHSPQTAHRRSASASFLIVPVAFSGLVKRLDQTLIFPLSAVLSLWHEAPGVISPFCLDVFAQRKNPAGAG